MKIAFVLSNYPWKPIGGVRVIYEYANRLASRGHEVSLVHPRFMQNWAAPKNWLGHVRRRLGFLRNLLFRPRFEWQTIDPRVRRLFVSEPTAPHIPDGDAVFATAWETAEYVIDYPASKGVKFYILQHYEIWNGPSSRVDATWRMPLRKVVIARWLLEKGVELGASPSDMALICNGINFDRFRVIRDIEQRPKRVAMMYHTRDWKGSPEGIEALEIARSRHPDLQAILFGVFRRPRSLPSWIRYRYNPSQKELVEKIYNGSRIYLCSSWAEGWPLPPAEAMACGCAVVTTQCSGVTEYIEQDETGLLSPIRDPDGLAENLIRLLDDDGLRVRLAKSGHGEIRKYTWGKSTDLLEALLMASEKIELSGSR
jgi:glycosyltransferase involved in cell wall biosynthesis